MCGKGGVVFYGKTLYSSADAFPSQNFCSWDEGHQEKRKWGLFLRKTWGSAIEMNDVSMLHF